MTIRLVVCPSCAIIPGDVASGATGAAPTATAEDLNEARALDSSMNEDDDVSLQDEQSSPQDDEELSPPIKLEDDDGDGTAGTPGK